MLDAVQTEEYQQGYWDQMGAADVKVVISGAQVWAIMVIAGLLILKSIL
jgi:hypothetical protein